MNELEPLDEVNTHKIFQFNKGEMNCFTELNQMLFVVSNELGKAVDFE